MKELPTDLQDYSGELNTELRYENLSKDVLVKLLKEYARLLVATDGMWNTIIAKEVSPEKAIEWETQVWERHYDVEFPRIVKILNITGDDVVTMFKLMQFTADGYASGDQYKSDIDIKSKNHIVLTLTRCRTLEYFERHGADFNIKGVCGKGGLEEHAFNKYAHFINPKIKVTPIKLPPRKSPDEIACRWEFKLEV
jgi:hypothetical protein